MPLLTFSLFISSPPLVDESHGMEPSSTIEIAANDSYGMLTDHNGVDYFHTKGNKENEECKSFFVVSCPSDVNKLHSLLPLQVQIEDCVIKVKELVNVLIQMVIHTLVVMAMVEQEIEGIAGMQFRLQ